VPLEVILVNDNIPCRPQLSMHSEKQFIFLVGKVEKICASFIFC
jgi:hypothetical protein